MNKQIKIIIMKNLINKFASLKGAKFIGIKGYENKQGEIADLSVLVNFNYHNVKVNDFEKLKAFTVKDLNKLAADKGLNAETMFKAHSELLTSAEKNLSENKEDHTAQSQAQEDAYFHIDGVHGLKVHKDTMTVYIVGMLNHKTIIVNGDYPAKNKREKTICKEVIKKHLELRAEKYRQYNVGSVDAINVSGTTLVRV